MTEVELLQQVVGYQQQLVWLNTFGLGLVLVLIIITQPRP